MAKEAHERVLEARRVSAYFVTRRRRRVVKCRAGETLSGTHNQVSIDRALRTLIGRILDDVRRGFIDMNERCAA